MRTILLVDDEPHILRALTQHIGWAKLNLTIAGTASNGVDALALYRELKPDLVMTDVYMPGMSGIELVQALRAEDAELPIVILSGYEEFENAKQAMRFGVDHFLLKPASAPEIESVLAEVLQDLDTFEQRRRLEEHYKREIGQMLPYLREKFFYELLTTRYMPHEIREERLDYLGLPRGSEIAAASVKIMRPAFMTRLKERDWQLLRFGADNIVREILGNEVRSRHPDILAFALDSSENHFVLLFMMAGAGEDELQRCCEQTAKAATEKIRSLLKIEALAGIGSVKKGLHEMIDSYLESREALDAAEYQGMNQVYGRREWDLEPAAFDRCVPLLKQWNDALASKDLEKAKNRWEAVHKRLHEEEGGTLTDLQTVCVGAFSSLLFFWNDQFPEQPPPRPISQFLKEIQQFYTLKELTAWMNDWVLEWLRHCSQEFCGRKSNKLVENVKKYVELHYGDDIGFASVAKEMYVHPKYLSQLFKRETGQNFVQYLNQFRIQKAISYLQTGQHMVYEVSEMVGFKNATYFSQVFKMMTGKSPSDYFRL